MQSGNFLPCAELTRALLPAYGPCPGFSSICGSMRWIPECGHVPRGFCGALGQLSDVELVLVVAEPGNPHGRESYSAAGSSQELFETVCRYVYGCFESSKDQFHRNVRYILNRCWPGLPFAEQMRRTWITESTLCSAEAEGGTIPFAVNRFCVDSYLSKQLAVLPHATVATLGGKARNRIGYLRLEFIAAFAAAPPGCNFAGAKESWEQVAIEVQKRTSARRGI
jgi:hypothetical protein